MSGAHARLSASSANRWLACPGSVPQDDKPSFYAAQGTFAHSIASQCLDHGVDASDFLLKRDKVEGFDVECDQEMVDAIQIYLDEIRADHTAGDIAGAEIALLAPLQTIDPDLGGTADFRRYRPSTRHLKVWDFKFGSGTYVEADDNEQGLIYCIGVMVEINAPVEDVEFVIVQPRFEGAKPVRTFKFKATEVLEFIADLKDAADKTRLPNPPRVAGDHCKFCSHARTCKELSARQTALMAADFTGLVDYKDLATALASVALVKERIKAIEEFAYTEAVAGRFTANYGYKLVDKRPVRRWKSEGDFVEWAQKLGIEPYAPRDPLSPAQVEKALAEVAPKGKKKEAGKVLEPLVERVSSGTVLVPVADARPEVKRLQESDFAVIDGHAEKEQQPPVNLF